MSLRTSFAEHRRTRARRREERAFERVLAVLGITAWRLGFERPRAVAGLQPEQVGGAVTWVVPNPSGLNAHHQLPDLARIYGQLRPPAG